MPRLTIFNSDEIKTIDKPPMLLPDKRYKYFALSDKLLSLMVMEPTDAV